MKKIPLELQAWQRELKSEAIREKKLKYPKHLRHLSIERLEILAKIFTPRGGI